MKKLLLLLGLPFALCHATQVTEAAGFQYTVDDSFVKLPHPGKRLAPDTYFDGYGSRQQGFGIGGQAWRVADWQTVVKQATEKLRSETPATFLGELIEVSDKSDSGEPITVVYVRTDSEMAPVFVFYSFKTAPHAWMVYFVIGRSKEPADYLLFAKSIYKTVKITANQSKD